MALYKCHICGSTVHTNEGDRFYTCGVCGKTQALPDYCSEHVSFLYGRANHYLRTRKFDKALQCYQQIAGESPKDCHAFFSIAVSRYGISFVDEAGSFANEPRLYRVHSASILNDPDYVQAIALADDERRRLYIDEAKQIEAVRKEIIERAERAPMFDAFITYREHDAKNRMTPETEAARNLYNYLTEEGFRVFFEKITTAGEIGLNYDAFLYKALYTSKVMFVFGSKPEYFNDIPIRNAWSIFHERMRNREKKVIVNCVEELQREDLPEELQRDVFFQYTSVSFIRESIELCQQASGGVLYLQAGAVTGEEADDRENRLREIFAHISAGDFYTAEGLCQTFLSGNPDHPQAYLGLLLCDMKVRSKEELADCKEPFTKNKNYRKILSADPELSKELQTYLDRINKRNLDGVYARKYSYAMELFENGKQNKESMLKAKKAFELMNDYRESRQLADECETIIRELEEKEHYAKAEEQYETAVRYLEKAESVRQTHLGRYALDSLEQAERHYREVNHNGIMDSRIAACEELRERASELLGKLEGEEQEQRLLHRRQTKALESHRKKAQQRAAKEALKQQMREEREKRRRRLSREKKKKRMKRILLAGGILILLTILAVLAAIMVTHL